LAELMESAESSRGLVVTAEQGDLPRLDRGSNPVPTETVVSPAHDPATVAVVSE
jgi:hypothetical protein